MNKIIKILGPSGAGKTTAVRELMAASGNVLPVQTCGEPGTKLQIVGHSLGALGLTAPVYVVGKYDATGCGGVDTIDSSQKVMDDVEFWHQTHHVVYEGLLQSTYYGAMGKWSQKYGDNFIYAWLNTPLEVCMERLHARRAANGTKRELNVAQAEAKWETVRRAFQRAQVEGHRTIALQWNQPTTPQLLELLK